MINQNKMNTILGIIGFIVICVGVYKVIKEMINKILNL